MKALVTSTSFLKPQNAKAKALLESFFDEIVYNDLGVPLAGEQILERLGADRVIIPEREIADRLALGLTTSGVMEFIELSKEYGIVEMNPPASWVGKTIRSLEVRTRYGANIIAVREGGKLRIPPEIDVPLSSTAILVVLGSYNAMEKLEKLESPEN